MTTIVVRTAARCSACGVGEGIDHVATGKRAASWRRAVNLPQPPLAEKLGMKQSFYSALENGSRHWTPDLVKRFEDTVRPMLQERNVTPP